MAGKSPTRTQADRRAATRRKLLEAAEHLIAERGFEAASLAAIAEEAGVSKGAIYHHFQSKNDLLLALLEARFEERIEAIPPIAATAGASATQRLVQEIPFDRRWNLLFLEFAVRAARDAKFRKKLRGRLARLRRESARGIERFLEAERIESELSAEQLALAVAALGNGLAIEGLTDPAARTDPLYASVLGLLLEGLVSRMRTR
jgi:AcrR family transcriptional regulator